MNGGVLLRPDPKGPAFTFAILLHGSLIGAFVLLNWINANGPKFGAPDAGGASVGVEAVGAIPLPQSGRPNPLASQSESDAPQERSKPVERVQKEVIPPDAIKLNLKKEKKAPAKEAAVKQRFRPIEELEKNQLYSKAPQAVSSPLYSQMSGSGRVGTGANTTLGTQFAGYAQQLRELVARNWQTGDVTAQTAPLVIATFDLMKDGSIRNLAILQSSGIQSLDFSVRRAIEGVRFPPIPPGFDRSYAKCEFTFELKK